MTPETKRCAIYTRKSSEEGLEQDFNSLHAQREACIAYITSQKHEGWQAIKTNYDDGGFSGGNMERPALKQLMTDINTGKIDIIVVYKVDRLSRSLHDFARMVEVFDKYNVSFVSVTQQFNTTSSMGRLTLNVLLSFAQFEREVTSERIRDKIAASKKKGMWMGGTIPLGYEVHERKLLINHEEAKTVNYIFESYLKTGCVRMLKNKMDQENIRSKPRVKKDGTKIGGFLLSRGSLYKFLANPLYIGQVRHKGICYPGQHQAIIPQNLWGKVQELIASNTIGGKYPSRKSEPSPLNGKLFDEFGERLMSVHAKKKERRYRYYISESLVTSTRNQANNGWRIPAQEIENIATHATMQILNDEIAIASALQTLDIPGHQIPTVLHQAHTIKPNNFDIINKFIQRVELKQDAIHITLTLASIVSSAKAPIISREVAIKIKRRGIEMRLIIGDTTLAKTDPKLIKTIARAHMWLQELVTGKVKSFAEIATRENIDKGTLSRTINLAFLSPEIVQSIIEGKQSVDMTSECLLKRINLPIDWDQQRRILGSLSTLSRT